MPPYKATEVGSHSVTAEHTSQKAPGTQRKTPPRPTLALIQFLEVPTITYPANMADLAIPEIASWV